MVTKSKHEGYQEDRHVSKMCNIFLENRNSKVCYAQCLIPIKHIDVNKFRISVKNVSLCSHCTEPAKA